jgi:hypothetical protein
MKRLEGFTGGTALGCDLRRPAFREFNAAVDALTLRCRNVSSEERSKAIEYLARAEADPDILMIFSGILRRFAGSLAAEDKLKIAEILSAHPEMPPLAAATAKSALLRAMEVERSSQVEEALHRAVCRLSGANDEELLH